MVKIKISLNNGVIHEVEMTVEEYSTIYLSSFNNKVQRQNPTTNEIIHVSATLSLSEVKKFIESNEPDMEHSISSIAKHFFGRAILGRSENILYHKLRGKIIRAQKIIENEQKGKFIANRVIEKRNGESKANKPYKVFRFTKNI